jgi:phosphoribosylglycinamide formyltransferase 1
MARRRVAVLISGSGSNLQALIDANASAAAPVALALVVSNRPNTFGLARARAAGIAARTIDHRGFPDRETFEAELDRALTGAGVELVCLAGFLRVLGAPFVDRWRDRLLNIHPSLLPAFRGLHTHARALAAGAAVHGCTVHLVRPELDDGPILVQGVAPVLPGDDEASLGARVLELEHRCYPLALDQFATGALTFDGERVRGPGQRLVVHPSLQ